MKILQQTIGFIVFAVAVEAMWILLRVDVAEDINIFGEAPCWPWPIGAAILVALLATIAGQLRRPTVRNGLILGTLAVLFGVGLLVPWLIGGDGLAVGLLWFLNSHWILMVATYWCLLWAIPKIIARRKANQAMHRKA